MQTNYFVNHTNVDDKTKQYNHHKKGHNTKLNKINNS